jgi:hypothetical protein
MNALLPASDSFGWPTFKLEDYEKPVEYCAALEAQGTEYGLGAKADPLGCDLSEIHAIDCSGFVRDGLFRATGRPDDFDFPDGSATQHEHCQNIGLKVSTPIDAHNHDNIWRIAFLTPEDGGGIGHVLFVRNGLTYESHGSTGPASRAWGSAEFMGKMTVYVLALS